MTNIRALKEYKERILRKIVDNEISSLDMKYQTIIFLRFGLDGEGAKSVKEVAKLLGISEELVQKIEGDALRALYKKR